MSAEQFLPLWKDDRVHSLAIYLQPDGSRGTSRCRLSARDFSSGGQFITLVESRAADAHLRDLRSDVRGHVRAADDRGDRRGRRHLPDAHDADHRARARARRAARDRRRACGSCGSLLLWESAMIGLLAAVVGVASGICLSFVLTGVINRAFFGWTIQLAFPWGSLAFTPFWIIAVGDSRGRVPGVARGAAGGGGGVAERMRRVAALLLLALLVAACVRGRVARRGARLAVRVPARSSIHEEFKTEWWYFTGNLADANGRRFGYQLTFFRQGIRPSGGTRSRAVALRRRRSEVCAFHRHRCRGQSGSDLTRRRAAARSARPDSMKAIGWRGSTRGRCGWMPTERFICVARCEGRRDRSAICGARSRRRFTATDGISRKAAIEGHASHYYSLTRLTTGGQAARRRRDFRSERRELVRPRMGDEPTRAGADRLGLAVGAFRRRHRADAVSDAARERRRGSELQRHARSRQMARRRISRAPQFRMTPSELLEERQDGRAVSDWLAGRDSRSAQIVVNVRAVLQNQELALLPLAYWEGAVDVTGTREGKPLKGRGYLELTGYAGPLRELQR